MEVPVDASASMVDAEHERAPSVPSSPPMSPGFFQEVNGARDDELDGGSSPVPPPHWINISSTQQPSTPQIPVPPFSAPLPKPDPEAFKAAGNKFFLQKDYRKAIEEYTRGGYPNPA